MKKHLLILFAAGVCLLGCKENSMDVPEPAVLADSFSNENGSWTRLEDFVPEGDQDGYGFAIGNKGYLGSGGFDLSIFKEYNFETKQYTAKSQLPIDFVTDFVAFSIGSMGYIGAGTAQAGGGDLFARTDFLQYNPQTDTWSRKAILPESITEAVGFSINGKGYIGVGKLETIIFNDESRPEYFYSPTKSLYEYSPESDCWVKKADFPGVSRVRAVAFAIGNKAYLGTGAAYLGTGLQDQTDGLKDFWEYDPSTNRWTRKADFPGEGRLNAVGFSIGNKGYIGTGQSAVFGSRQKDVWEYEPLSNSWKRIDDFPGGERTQMTYFSTGTKGYVAGGDGIGSLPGDLADFWEYDPTK